MTDSTDDMHARGMLAVACVIDAAGSQPYDSDGQLLVSAEPTLQDWKVELDDLDRDEFTDVEREECLDGWVSVMGPWRELIQDGTDAPDATRQVAGELLEEAAEADEPASPLQAARTLLGHSRVEMAQRMGVPTTGHQAPTLRQWERADRRPEWGGRKKIRAMAAVLRDGFDAEAALDGMASMGVGSSIPSDPGHKYIGRLLAAALDASGKREVDPLHVQNLLARTPIEEVGKVRALDGSAVITVEYKGTVTHLHYSGHPQGWTSGGHE